MSNMACRKNNIYNRELNALYLIKTCATSSFAVFYSTLALLLTVRYGVSTAIAASISAKFFSANFLLPMVGGKILKKDNMKEMFVIGNAFFFTGLLILLVNDNDITAIELAIPFILVESAVSNMVLLAKLNEMMEKQQGEKYKEAIYGVNHAAMNVGFFLGTSISGIFYYFNMLQGLMVFCLIATLLTIFLTLFLMDGYAISKTKAYSKSTAILALICLAIYFVLHFVSLQQEAVIGGIAIILGFLTVKVKVAKLEPKKISRRLNKVIALMLLAVIFWSAYMLEPTLLPVFVNAAVQTNFFGVNLPPHAVFIFGPLSVVFFSYKISNYNRRRADKGNPMEPASLYILGMLILSLGLAFLSYGIYSSGKGLVSPAFAIMFLLVLACVESFIIVMTQGAITDCVPKEYNTFFQGINYAIIGFSIMVTGQVVGLSGESQGVVSKASGSMDLFFNVCVVMFIMTLFAGALCYMFRKKLRIVTTVNSS